ncbi:MAG: SUMF1/EgtB/PvdO family nonheme iron enzyme [Planctomycetota bacterium]|nr:SUMF1/EgtB/PvdO family nonheme iron enzyme [Planctomycetota bacterium]
MADSKKQSTTPENGTSTSEGEAADAIARALGMDEEGTRARAEGGAESLGKAGPIELDKDGALVGRKKLEPKRAHRPETPDVDLDDEQEAEAEAGKPRKAALPPKLSVLRPLEEDEDAPEADGESRFDEEIRIEAGEFRFGEAAEAHEVPGFHIDKYPVTNAQYETFVRATGHRPPLYWPNGHLAEELYDHPVVGVDYFDALAYARWRDKDLPFEDEWERAARGTDGRTFPWGEANELNASNTARAGLKTTVPVGMYDENVSPDGCVDMVGNCWELTHTPAPGGGVVVRGGSWYDFALYAKTFFRFAARSDARNGTIGFRCVRRDEERDAPREVDPAHVEAEIIARTGPQPPVDRSTWNPERRDLVPDFARLRTFEAEVEAERERAKSPGIVNVPVPEPVAPPPPPAPAVDEPVEDTIDEPAAREPTLEERVRAEQEAVEEAGLEAAAAAKLESFEKAVEAGEAGREHVSYVEAPPPPAPDSAAIQEAAEQVMQAETLERAAAAEAPPVRTPKMLWSLVVLGFLLVAAVAYVIVDKMGAEEPVKPASTDVVDEPIADDYLAKLPPMPASDADVEPVRLIDAADAEARAALEAGNWLVVFVDPVTDEGKKSLQAAHNISLRMSASGTRVALVVPRNLYENEDGSLPGEVELAERVQEAWKMQGLTVVLDPYGERSLRTELVGPGDGIVAVVTHEGRLEMKAWAPKSAGFFTVFSLAPIAAEAHALSPAR